MQKLEKNSKMIILSDYDKSEFIGQIIDIFEDFLEEKNVQIKNDDRTDGGAIIFGQDYDELRCKVQETLANWQDLFEC